MPPVLHRVASGNAASELQSGDCVEAYQGVKDAIGRLRGLCRHPKALIKAREDVGEDKMDSSMVVALRDPKLGHKSFLERSCGAFHPSFGLG